MLGLIFSYNRALQLDGTLRSFLLHCHDIESLNLFVLFRTSSPLHARLYAQLRHEYATWPQIVFIEQRNFRRDVIELFYRPISGKHPDRLRLSLIYFGWRFGFLNNLWNIPGDMEDMVLFLVDDNIFVKDFLLQDVVQELKQNPDALGFSLRLGTNTTYSYSRDKSQSLPIFVIIKSSTEQPMPGIPAYPDIVKFNWTSGEADFGYPLEVSSSIYRLADIRPVLNILPFQNPNFLESRLSRQAYRFRQLKPYLLCYRTSVTFCNPINKVQTIHQNRSGVNNAYSVDKLAHKYELGERIKVAEYKNFVPTGCHQEVDLVFETRY